MRYFNCDICNKEDVKQSDMCAWSASICDTCREENEERAEKLDKQRSDKHFKKWRVQ